MDCEQGTRIMWPSSSPHQHSTPILCVASLPGLLFAYAAGWPFGFVWDLDAFCWVAGWASGF